MVTKVLCVAEKPSIAKAVANHLSGGNIQTVSPRPFPTALNDIDHV
jgi:DNA topoisomerase-3